MNNQPLVSILMPCYNAEKYVAETLTCLLGQDYENIEIILVDDGSSDKSYDIVKQFETDPRVQVFQQPNSGACVARNLAFKHSKGDYIMYMDTDDLMSSNKIAKQIERFRQLNDPLAVLTCGYEEFVNEVPTVWSRRLHYHDYETPTDLLLDIWSNGAMVPVTCYMISRKMVEMVGDWDVRLKKNQDGDYFSRVLMKATSVHFVDDCCFFYRRGHASVSTTAQYSEAKLSSVLLTYRKQKSILELRGDNEIRKALARNFSLIMNSAKYQSALYKEAQAEIRALGQKPVIINPPTHIHLLSDLFGAEFCLFLKSLLSR